MFQTKKNRFKKLFEFIRNYRINVKPDKQFLGVKDTLVGWAIVGFCAVISEPILDPLVLETSFVILYFSGALAMFLNVAFDGLLQGSVIKSLKELLITTKDDQELNKAHLTVKQRIIAIYLRSALATVGYIALNVAKIHFSAIDNSEIFGADAFFFALLASWILHEKRNLKEWVGIATACAGVLFILYVDIASFSLGSGITSGVAGVFSALTFALIFFITTIIVRHDTPKCIVFHQCFVGGVIASIFLLFNVLFTSHQLKEFSFPSISSYVVKNSIVLGVLYATALYRFLRAFLFTNPVIIAVLGYSFIVFTLIFELFFRGVSIGPKDIFSSILIFFGCALLLREEHKKNQNAPGEMDALPPTYSLADSLDPPPTDIKASKSTHVLREQSSLRLIFKSLKDRFYSGLLDRYSYVSERHEFNKILLEYSYEIKDSDVETIRIIPDRVVFTFKPLKIELETDGAARSAPFEVLNFGSYEPEDEKVAYALITNGNVILDIGANIGWYTINFAKRFPLSTIYAFEPIPPTYEFLKRNVERNKVMNCNLFSYGISDKNEDRFLYYFKGWSAIASIENLTNHQNAKKINCHLRTLDSLVNELQLNSVDFIKCDIEGSELFMLKGSETTINRFKPILFIELCEEWSQKCDYKSEDIITLLESWGYVLFEACEGKLLRREKIKLEDNGRYNYFFLNLQKHDALIEKFSV